MSREEATEARVRVLLDEYLRAERALRKARVIRTRRPIQSDYAEWWAARHLRLRLAPNAVQAGYDATDSQGQRYQIKARIVRSLSANTSFDFRSFEHPFDFLLGVFFDRDPRLLGVIKVPQRAVIELSQNNRAGRRFRWYQRVAGDSRVRRLVWDRSA